MTANNLRSIHDFPDLVRYLEDELGWPLQEYGFDDLTFEYSPAELGLKEEDAAAVKAIHQLRPIVTGQPWGIFFVEFEKKKLPVVVLRRILSHLVIRKRANKAAAPAWHAEDLLFVTAFGEDEAESREIAFAHFHQAPGDMPTLHVLGWDGGDTPLKLAHVDRVLHQRLHWPDDETDADAWRTAWRSPFKHRIGHVIRTADQLAETLAKLARGIRDKARRMLDAESERGALRKLHKAFQTGLIHDLTEENFADTYAQTITYGLLTAAISRTDMSEGRHGTVLLADNVADIVPVTNPFLKEMLQTFLKVGGRKGGIDFDELGIQDVVELLRGDETDLPAILLDFGNKTRGEDPVIHFYEHFLSAYNKKLKVQRGVFYTPQPVVSYIVRSVHELLQTEFSLEDGLASIVTWGEMATRFLPSPASGRGAGGEGELKIPEGTSPNTHFVTILDPATGTGTFLVEVVAVIHRTLTDKWKKQGMSEAQQLNAWNDYVPKHLLPRLHGYELMMAPYAIAHMKLGLKLHETGYRFGSEERVRVYLTNALEPAHEVQPQLEVLAPALAHEAQAVSEVKQRQCFTVVIGNPPYSVSSQNNGKWIVALCDDIKQGLEGERNIQPLSDDYLKFLRFSFHLVERSRYGLIGMITNREYIQGVIHRSSRKSFASKIHSGFICDLHGQRGELFNNDTQDENVFDIEKGVAVSFYILTALPIKQKALLHVDMTGNRQSKYRRLSESTVAQSPSVEIQPSQPNFFFKPWNTSYSSEYRRAPSITDLFLRRPVTGFATHRDQFAIDFDKHALRDRLARFLDPNMTDALLRSEFALGDTRDWHVASARIAARHDKDIAKRISKCLYRPFDHRWVMYSDDILEYSRRDTMQHISKKSLALICSRIVKDEVYAHAFVSDCPVEKIFLSPKSSNNAQVCISREQSDPRQLVSNPSCLIIPHQLRNLGITESDDVFAYIYAVLHSPTYRIRYAEFLKIDFPRIPLPGGLPLFQALATLGGELVSLHLLESPKVNTFITRFEGKGDNSIPKKPTWKDGAVWINATQRFEGVPEAVWNFHIGGYQVCEKWLKDRKGRTLSDEDIAHYQRVVVALNETIRLMTEIDQVIEQHGGWPGAFQSSQNAIIA